MKLIGPEPKGFKTSDGFSLGRWAETRRYDRTRGILSKERIVELDTLGFRWKLRDEYWSRGIRYLKQFFSENGHAKVRQNHTTLDGFRLGTWLSKKRDQARNGKLSEERKNELDDLGMVWDPLNDDWEIGLNYFKNFIKENGHSRVSSGFKTSDAFPLGSWLQTKRISQRKGILPGEQISELGLLGFTWDPLRDQDWNEAINSLNKFILENGHARVPVGFEMSNGLRLGQWVDRCRSEYKSDILSAKRVAELDELGFIWNPFEEDWQRGLKYFKSFIRENGHSRVTSGFKAPDGYTLGRWVSKNRTKKNSGILTAERIAALDNLGFIWSPLEELWEEGFTKLHQFNEREGHSKVPPKHKEKGFKLGSWVSRQRQVKEKMSLQKMKKLDALGFVWDPESKAWEEGFAKLQQFRKREGTCKVPMGYKEDGFTLGNWVAVQRRTRKKNNLSEGRIERLDAMDFVWSVKSGV